MKSIVIIAFSEELDKVLKIIRRDNVFIKYIISCPTNNLAQIIRDNDVHCNVIMYNELPEVLKNTYFDYVIISDTKKTAGEKRRIVTDCKQAGCLDEQIIDITDWYSIDTLPLYNILKSYLDNKLEAYFFITGVSHAYAGTDMRCYSKTGLNLAYTSQDLFLDFELAKLVLQNVKKLKYAIIGVAPFSIHYDLSNSVNNAYRMMLYYPIIKTLHHLCIKEVEIKEIFNDVYFKSFEMFNSELTFKQRLTCASCNKNIAIDDYLAFRNNLSFWDNKYYPNTAIENKKILNDYVEYCMVKGIQPNLVIFPVSSCYNNFFSKKKFQEVREYCHYLANKYNINFYDLSDDKHFNDSDFFDVEHLNINGAQKVSNLLSEIIL